MQKHSIKENEFFPAPGGEGSINGQPGWGTFASPEVSQNSANFAHSDQNKAVDQYGNTRQESPSTASLASDLNAIYAKKDTPTPDEIIAGVKYELGQQIKKDKYKAKQAVLTNLKKDPHFYSGLKMLNIDDESMVNNMSENTNPNAGLDESVYNKLKEMKSFKVTDYIGLRIMKEQLVSSLTRLTESGKINFDGAVASLKPMNEEKKHPNDAPLREKVEVNPEATKKIFEELTAAKDQKFVVNSKIVDVMKEMWEQKRQRSAWKNEQ